jgi:hypothetical protein
MASKLFTFTLAPTPNKKKRNPYLLPNSELLPASNLSPLSKAAKKRKFKGARNKHPAFGPMNAPAMSSMPDVTAPAIAGYGNSLYGALPFGEAIKRDEKKISCLKYGKIVSEFNLID